MQSLNAPQPGPTPIFEDNQATIAQVLNDRLTPRVRHNDVLVDFINDQFSRERLTPIYFASEKNKADKNSKPHGGQTLQTKYLATNRFIFICHQIQNIIKFSNLISLKLVFTKEVFSSKVVCHLCKSYTK